MIGTAEIRYFVQGLGPHKLDSKDFGSLPDAERYFDLIAETGPKGSSMLGTWREAFGFL